MPNVPFFHNSLVPLVLQWHPARIDFPEPGCAQRKARYPWRSSRQNRPFYITVKEGRQIVLTIGNVMANFPICQPNCEAAILFHTRRACPTETFFEITFQSSQFSSLEHIYDRRHHKKDCPAIIDLL